MRHLRLALLLVASLTPLARAEHAVITLEVVTPAGQETAFSDQAAPDGTGHNPRPVLHARPGDRLQIRWFLTNAYPHKTLEGLVVHAFVAPQEKVGQQTTPTPGEDAPLETAFDLDLKPGRKVGGRHTLTLQKPGAYLVRIETLQTQSDHEHFAAIDLVIDDEAP